jgi:hypothetical protein
MNHELIKIRDDLENYIINRFNNHKDPNKQHYNVGDTVWTIFTGKALPAKIDSIDDYRTKDRPSGYVFYWIKLNCYTKLDHLIEKIKFHIMFDILKLPYHPSKKCIGHSVGPEELFDDQESAEFALKLYNIFDNLDNLLDSKEE